jgi:hypothetical protein
MKQVMSALVLTGICVLGMTASLFAGTVTYNKNGGGNRYASPLLGGGWSTCVACSTYCPCTVSMTVSTDGPTMTLVGPYNQLKVSDKALTLTETQGSHSSQRSVAGFQFISGDYTVTIVDCPLDRRYENMTIPLDGVTLDADGNFSIIFPPLP